jgi:hypothetical protein
MKDSYFFVHDFQVFVGGHSLVSIQNIGEKAFKIPEPRFS